MNTLADNTNVYLVKFDKTRPYDMRDGYPGETDRFILTVSWSRGGTAMAYFNWRDKADGRAGGYGYDKESAAVCELFERLFKIEIKASAAGMETVKRLAAEKGVQIYSLSDALQRV